MSFSLHQISRLFLQRFEVFSGCSLYNTLQTVGLGVRSRAHFVTQPFRRGFKSDGIDKSQGWVVRLANENNFMSSCRNSYLTTALGAAVITQGDFIPHARLAAHVAMLLAWGVLSSGTLHYVVTLSRLRPAMHLSRWGAGLCTAFALSHYLIWSVAVGLILDYVDDDATKEVREMTAHRRSLQARENGSGSKGSS